MTDSDPRLKERIGTRRCRDQQQLRGLRLGDDAPVCQICGATLRAGTPLSVYAFQPAGSGQFEVGHAVCAGHDRTGRSFTLGVREVVVGGRVGTCRDQATQSAWPVLVAPRIEVVSPAATTSAVAPGETARFRRVMDHPDACGGAAVAAADSSARGPFGVGTACPRRPCQIEAVTTGGALPAAGTDSWAATPGRAGAGSRRLLTDGGDPTPDDVDGDPPAAADDEATDGGDGSDADGRLDDPAPAASDGGDEPRPPARAESGAPEDGTDHPEQLEGGGSRDDADVEPGGAGSATEAADDDGGTSVSEPSLTESVRQFVRLDRDNECEFCAAAGDDEAVTLEIHHRHQRADGGTNHPENLLLLCQSCHRRIHGNTPVDELVAANSVDGPPADGPLLLERDGSADADGDDTGADERRASTATDDGQPAPLPPQRTPNETDAEILAAIEEHGPVQTGVIAERVGYSKQYVRRQCWKLSGEQLIARTDEGMWELRERASDEAITIGLPDDPQRAKRAGRDEVIRRLSAHGMAHTEIAEITGLSRNTVAVAVDRARALRIDDSDDPEVDLASIAVRMSALLDVIEHAEDWRDSVGLTDD